MRVCILDDEESQSMFSVHLVFDEQLNLFSPSHFLSSAFTQANYWLSFSPLFMPDASCCM